MISKIFRLLILGSLVGLPVMAHADMIPMRDFIQLRRGMSEAEVLYRVGRFDYETVRTDYFHNVVEKRWYYIPHQEGSNKWITEIVINNHGKIKHMDRYRARK